ncbi:RND family efflux transporter, MFP subunit [Chitinophaga costaii]|uniref:RND family efflux transporter, MFP subunit n=1 Tax=Chitinophaga costaii TaxID=1335309 RepID=A0A1C4ANM0_9BACT|nr:efflux RND transporter periplasmic adaptor subunit [Chitinophaga costaii]PUZ26684.1 efflux RND transporter periplasmic adaptor subunit [Chitinophaga costaii]SCB96272.1 RND family efflux transporter, MFP subunit [Chitinophaga costaii]
MKKILLWSVLVIAALALIVWKLNINKKENDAKTDFVKQSNTGDVPVLVAKVAQTDFSQGFSANGNFEPIRELTYLSETSGRILKLMVDEGSVVRQGQQIARVDDQILGTDLDAAKANIAQLKVDKERYESAFTTGGVTQKQVDDAILQYNLAVSRLEAASRRVSDTYVKAPISGTINKKYVEQGAYLSPGNKMFDIVDVSKLKLSVSVPESQVVTLKTGDAVKVSCNVYPEVSYNAKITFIAAKGDNSLNYPVEMEVINIQGKPLKAGMYGSAHFGSTVSTPMIMIPRTAFVGGVNSNQVYVMEGNIAKLKTVTAGHIYGEQVEIRGGLQVGESVITSGQINLTDGATVMVTSSK